jgi:lipoprotein-releasing system ATP-binding protein
MDCLIRAENLCKSYGSLRVLHHIDFELLPSEFVAITGASGSGKSTLLHLLGGLDQPDSGQLFVAGEPYPTSGRALDQFRNQQLGLVFQFHHLMPELNALENIMLPASIAGRPSNEVSAFARELADRLGIFHRLTHRPDELSGGEQQRVAIARALINRPKLLLADEPSGNLDRARSEELYELLADARKAWNVAVVVVTHSEWLAGKADRRLHLQDGAWA